jgi:hypothetical protein
MAPCLTGECSYTVDPSNRLVLLRLRGAANGAAIAQCATRLRTLEPWSEDLDVIWVEDELAYVEVTPEEIDAVAEAHTNGAAGKDIIVSGRSDYDLAMALHAVQRQTQKRPAAVCATLEEALSVVGLSECPEGLAPDRSPIATCRWQVVPGGDLKTDG